MVEGPLDKLRTCFIEAGKRRLAGDTARAANTDEMAPVTYGERIMCVGWIESLIADIAQRELLFDLENLRVSLRAQMSTRSAELVTLDKVIANLIRQWAVT